MTNIPWFKVQTDSEQVWLVSERYREIMLSRFLFYVSIFVAVCDKLQWSCPMMIGSHQSERQFPRVVTTWNHLYHPSLAKPNFARTCLEFHCFPVAMAIFACTLLFFCPSLIWLSRAGLLLGITLYTGNVDIIFFAIAKGYLHRCCCGQNLSILFPYHLAIFLTAYNVRRSTAYLNIMQRYSLP